MKRENKHILSLLALLMVSVICFGFIACGPDDEEDDYESAVIGTWTASISSRETLKLTFKSGGKGTFVDTYNDPYSGPETETGTFTYKMQSKSKGTITTKGYDSYSGDYTNTVVFRVSGKTMKMWEDEDEEGTPLIFEKN